MLDAPCRNDVVTIFVKVMVMSLAESLSLHRGEGLSGEGPSTRAFPIGNGSFPQSMFDCYQIIFAFFLRLNILSAFVPLVVNPAHRLRTPSPSAKTLRTQRFTTITMLPEWTIIGL